MCLCQIVSHLFVCVCVVESDRWNRYFNCRVIDWIRINRLFCYIHHQIIEQKTKQRTTKNIHYDGGNQIQRATKQSFFKRFYQRNSQVHTLFMLLFNICFLFITECMCLYYIIIYRDYKSWPKIVRYHLKIWSYKTKLEKEVMEEYVSERGTME
jgi:hypothetical protein